MYSFANFFADHIFLQKKRKEKCKKRKKSTTHFITIKLKMFQHFSKMLQQFFFNIYSNFSSTYYKMFQHFGTKNFVLNILFFFHHFKKNVQTFLLNISIKFLSTFYKMLQHFLPTFLNNIFFLTFFQHFSEMLLSSTTFCQHFAKCCNIFHKCWIFLKKNQTVGGRCDAPGF
jgi:hypothetical protein